MSEIPGATAGFLEFSGAAIQYIERALDRVERGMALLGARMREEPVAEGEAAASLQPQYLSGLTDVDAITLSSLRLYGLGKLPVGETVNSILIAFFANLSFKLCVVFLVAGKGLGRGIGVGFLAITVGTLGGWALTNF